MLVWPTLNVSWSDTTDSLLLTAGEEEPLPALGTAAMALRKLGRCESKDDAKTGKSKVGPVFERLSLRVKGQSALNAISLRVNLVFL